MKVNEKINFDKRTHTYTLNSGCTLKSVTTLIAELFPVFEREKIAGYTSKKTGQPVKEVLSEWEEASNHGSRVHGAIESHILRRPMASIKTDLDALKVAQGLKALHKMFRRLGEPVLNPEVIIGSEELGIAGAVDLIIQHNDLNDKSIKRVVTLVDWKTNKNISENGYGKKGIHSTTKHLDDSAIVKYGLQLSFYAYILEQFYGYTIHELCLVHLMEEAYNIIIVPYMSGDVKNIINGYNKLEGG